MKRIVLILTGIFMMITMLGLLFFSGAIYDAEKKYSVDTYFFEPDSQSARRVLPPASVDSIPSKMLRNLIIARFVNEYFYVIPDVNNAEKRTEFEDVDGKVTALWGLVPTGKKMVCKNWAKNVAPEIKQLAEKMALRMVRISKISESESGHLVIEYELRTWYNPNNPMAKPVVTNGELYLSVTSDPVRMEQTEEVLQRLKEGVDPVSAFKFNILDVVQN